MDGDGDGENASSHVCVCLLTRAFRQAGVSFLRDEGQHLCYPDEFFLFFKNQMSRFPTSITIFLIFFFLKRNSKTLNLGTQPRISLLGL